MKREEHDPTADECKTRWNTLKRWYKQVCDNDERSGRQSYWKMNPAHRAAAKLHFSMRRSWFDVYNRNSQTISPTFVQDPGAEEEVRPSPPRRAAAGGGVQGGGGADAGHGGPPANGGGAGRGGAGGGGAGGGGAGGGGAGGGGAGGGGAGGGGASANRGGGTGGESSTMTGGTGPTPPTKRRKNTNARELTTTTTTQAMAKHTRAVQESASEQSNSSRACTELHCNTLTNLCDLELQAYRDVANLTCTVMREDISARENGYAILASALRSLSKGIVSRSRRDQSPSSGESSS
ncbi:hypothetical protein CBR_g31596 [Chara braunii]|uniref:Uncharacterized protein n=1 Tax=Chara braunii TaxID=69332 RepID=A0A388LFD8_CHABU|nr:hypothetical protein CBR_g31596 [Chara braunii]|eukprot:GBG81040.1 hypothetical protein CBR_g31596 [Chara braunii]